MADTVHMVSLGCPKNLVDSEVMLGQLRDAGYTITGDADEATIIIINTCGFIKAALSEAIETVLELAEKKKGNCRLLVVAGCMVQRYGQKVLKELPEVDAAISGCDAGNISLLLKQAEILKQPAALNQPDKSRQVYFPGISGDIAYLNGKRLLSAAAGSAYLKIAEGCDNKCTYCTIPAIKGAYRSRKAEDILAEAEWLAAECNIRELILVAQDTTAYGKDINRAQGLAFLAEKISLIDKIRWIRIMYCYPEGINDDLIRTIRDNDKICKYVDMPVQHYSDRILRLMGRKSRGRDLEAVIYRLRSGIPGLVLRSTVITGFPTENEQDHELLVRFIKETGFDRLGVFEYSDEEGAPSAALRPKVSQRIKKARRDEIMTLQQERAFAANRARIGKIYSVIVEGIADDGLFHYGRSCGEAPEIDGLIYFLTAHPVKIGDFAEVRILEADGYDLIGEAEHEPSE